MASSKIFNDLNNSVKFKLFLLSKLPSAFFMGIRINQINRSVCKIILPFKWFTKNPFKSIYFASQCAAAELSTGLFLAAMSEKYGKVSMLIVSLESNFIKKANKQANFTCDEGAKVESFLKDIFAKKEAGTICLNVKGHIDDTIEVSNFKFTWSVKPKS